MLWRIYGKCHFHNIRYLSISVVYKCRRIPSYDLKCTLTSLSSKVDREYSCTYFGLLSIAWGEFQCGRHPQLCSMGHSTLEAHTQDLQNLMTRIDQWHIHPYLGFAISILRTEFHLNPSEM